MIRFPKYKFNNRLLGGEILLRVTLGITWTQLYIYIYIYRERERERDAIINGWKQWHCGPKHLEK